MDPSYQQQYYLSDNGFLPSSLPLTRLPDPYYAPWESIISRLPTLLATTGLRREVHDLVTLSTDKLTTEGEWRRAYLILSFLTHGYIWGEDKVADVLPPCITLPLLAVSSYLELPPVATYAALNLWNFRTDSAAFDDLDSLRALHTFTDTESESWFYVVSVAMECRAAKILPVLLGALQSAARNDYQAVAAALRQFILCIQDVGALLDRMHERCDPTTFFFQIRPYLAGSKNMAAQGLPNGVFYDEGDGRGQWRQLRGGSNGQSSLIQFFDIVLGVEHTSNGTEAAPRPEKGFHHEVRGYMPGPHRRFLEHVSEMPNLRAFVAETMLPDNTPTDDEQKTALSAAFQDATKALATFRNKHLAIVTRYIIIPSRQKQSLDTAAASTATIKPRGLAADVLPLTNSPASLTGTGGTELLPFLKQTRDETLQAGLSVSTSVPS